MTAKRNSTRRKRRDKRIYVIMWSYYDSIGTDSGNVEILATNRKEAEKIFYELNPNYFTGYKNGKPTFNPKGGFVCEGVLTHEEWVAEGKPTGL